MTLPVHINQQLTAQYHREGYVIVPNLLKPREVEVLRDMVDMDQQGAAFTDDSGKRAARLAFWQDTHSSIWGVASTCPRIVNNIRILMGEEVAFFHGKVTLKEARTGGAWEWHQDYGYWYDQGYVTPRMISVSVALDDNTLDNGCMRLLKGSHHMGRLTHVRVGAQTGTDPERLKEIMPYFEEVPAIMPAGAALFFHSNTLHTSAPNHSDRHRRNFIMCYNALSNPQIGKQKSFEQFPCPVGSDDVIEKYALSTAGV